MSDYISRADAIEAVARLCTDGQTAKVDGYFISIRDALENVLSALPSADAVKVAYICDGRKCDEDCSDCFRTLDVEHAKDFKLMGGVYYQQESADAVQGEWIPCGEKMPKELERVNVTWLNHNPPFYYQHIKDIPQTDTAVYYRGKWYWWDATVIDVLAEYGEDCNAEQIDKDIEVIAWMPLPKPYREVGEA